MTTLRDIVKDLKAQTPSNFLPDLLTYNWRKIQNDCCYDFLYCILSMYYTFLEKEDRADQDKQLIPALDATVGNDDKNFVEAAIFNLKEAVRREIGFTWNNSNPFFTEEQVRFVEQTKNFLYEIKKLQSILCRSRMGKTVYSTNFRREWDLEKIPIQYRDAINDYIYNLEEDHLLKIDSSTKSLKLSVLKKALKETNLETFKAILIAKDEKGILILSKPGDEDLLPNFLKRLPFFWLEWQIDAQKRIPLNCKDVIPNIIERSRTYNRKFIPNKVVTVR